MDEKELLIPTKVVRCKRKTLSLQIKSNGDFIVRAPIRMPEKDIHAFIEQKKSWVETKRKANLTSPYTPLTFNKDENIWLFGEIYKIVLTDERKMLIKEGNIYIPKLNPNKTLVTFLKSSAKKYISSRVEELAALWDFEYAKISISSAKSCWGSCSHNNNLHFTYKLIMCPKPVIDYIILHELCHTKIKNHSDKFWDMVHIKDCNYKIKERWIKQNRGIINVI